MRLIDADAFWNPFEEEKEELENRTIKTSSALTAIKFIDFIKRRLDIQPTILQPERKIGRWTVTRLYVQCSECGECFPLKPQNYCPNCGARMVKEGEEHD